ncbi:hypothetical protein R1sor_011259 [Riccia sorocarpa]|uniref:Auxin efflux carrier family protein n=1 Tax=Riccia sorocarpa TaxID=122646 RepID=A0ABD3I0E2_9MARC
MGTDLFTAFNMAVLPVAKLLLTCAFGAWLASKSMQVLTAEGRKHMNMMVFLAYTPALIFSKLTNAVTIDNIVTWWYMPLNVILSYLMGSGLAVIVISYTNPPEHLKSLVIASCAAGNIGNIMLVLVPSICHDKDNPFGMTEVCTQNGIAYVSFGMLTGMVLTWSFIYTILKPCEKNESGIVVRCPVPVSSAGSSSAVSPHSSDFGEFQSGFSTTEFTDVELSEQKYKWNPGSHAYGDSPRSLSPLEIEHAVQPERSQRTLTSERCGCFKRIAAKYDIKRVFTPPTAAALAGLIVGLVPPLKWFFLGPFRAFTDSADIIGQAMIPCMNLVLGASLVQGSEKCEMPLTTILGIILVRFFALPVLGMMTVKIAHDFGFLPEDPLFRFVLMLQFTMPTAINVGTIAQLHGVGERDAALVLFYCYLAACICLTFWALIYLQYTFGPTSF